MDVLLESKQMDGQTEQEQCKRAIVHTLERIRDDKAAADVFGIGSQSFALLTEAAATLFNEPVAKVRAHYGGV
jgi:hypothetical protein